MPERPDQLFVEVQSALAGRYSLERELGRGGMGIVYLAREVRLDRPVAIKLLPRARAGDPPLRERFLREARTAAKLSHPHIIPIFTVDEVGAFVFFAMAYVAGETLTERVGRRGPLPASEAARVLREVAWALAYAHSQGLVHRDVKPDNIILEEHTGRALIADFGIASEVRGAAGLDGSEIIGTPEFMSPEQALGEPVDGRSDLYALGAVGYFVLSGKLPFVAAKATELLAKQITEPAPSLASVAAVPRRLVQAIDRCLAKDPAERPQTGEALAEQLGLALTQRRELPAGLRVFVKRNARLGGTGSAIYLVAIPFVLMLVGGFAGLYGAVGAFAASLTVVPFGVLLIRARSFLAAGFSPEELVVAFRTELELGTEERIFEHGRGPSRIELLLRGLGAGGLGLAGVTALVLINVPYPVMSYGRWMALEQILSWSSLVGGLSGFLAVTQLQRRVDLDTRIWARIWQGPIGRILFRLARRLVPPSSLETRVTHRPTELTLGLAAEQLFDQLPRETRRQLRELPDVVHRLEGDAQRLRRRLDELQDALGDRSPRSTADGNRSAPDTGVAADRIVTALERERDVVQRRFSEAVKALETIRLNLLRLHAGSGSVQTLTTDLGLARDVAAEIARQLAAQQEVDATLR